MKDSKTDKTVNAGGGNPIQNSIMMILGDEPLSARDIARQINFPRQKIYYHIKKLEKVNKIFVSETEVVNGIIKKKYLKDTPQLTQSDSEQGVSAKDAVQEIPDTTVLTQKDEVIGEDSGSADSDEHEITDDPIQEIPDTTVLTQEDEVIGEDSGPADSDEHEIADDPVQEIPDTTVLTQEDEDLGEDSGPADSDEHEITDDPVQEIPDTTVLTQEDEDLGEDSGSADSDEHEITDDPIQEIHDTTVLTQEGEDLGEDSGSADSDEHEIADDPVQEIPDVTDSSPLQDQEFVPKVISDNALVQNLMKAKGIAPKPGTENEAQRSQPPDAPPPPETVQRMEITIDDQIFLVPEGGLGHDDIDNRANETQKKSGATMTISDNNMVRGYLRELRLNEIDDESTEDDVTQSTEDEQTDEDPKKNKAKKQKKQKKSFLRSNWLYLYRLLSGYSKTVTFVQKGNSVTFLQATIKRKGFRIHKKQTYMLPLLVNEDTTIQTLPQLMHHVFTENFKLGVRKHYYVAVYSSEYKFEMDFLKIPILKKKELYDYMIMKLGKMFSADPENLIIDWIINDVQDKKAPTRDAICLISDKTPILNDAQYLLEQNIQLRYTTSIAKIQYDQFLFNHGPDSDGSALLLYIGGNFTRITLVNNWKLVESRKSSIGLDDFLELYLKLNESDESIDYESAREYMLTQPFIGDDSSPLRTVYEKLISEIKLSLTHFRQKNLLIGDDVLISGIVSTNPQMVDQMNTSLDMDISLLNVPKSLEEEQHEGLEEYYDNIGLLLDPKDRLNLLPYAQRQTFKFLFPTKLMRVILAGMLVVFATVVSVQYNTFISIKGPIAEKESQVKLALMERDLFFKFLAEAEALKTLARAQEQDKFAAEKTVYLLKILSKTLPENVTLSNLEFGKQDAFFNGEIVYNGSNLDLELNNLIDALKDNKYITDAELVSSNEKTRSLFTFAMVLRL